MAVILLVLFPLLLLFYTPLAWVAMAIAIGPHLPEAVLRPEQARPPSARRRRQHLIYPRGLLRVGRGSFFLAASSSASSRQICS